MPQPEWWIFFAVGYGLVIAALAIIDFRFLSGIIRSLREIAEEIRKWRKDDYLS